MRGLREPTRQERRAEAWCWVEDALQGQPLPSLLIVIGLGDGSLLDVLDERAPSTRVLALEPNPAHVRVFNAQRKWTAWRTSGRLVYLADPGYAGADEAWRLFKQKDEPRVVIHPAALTAPGNARATEVLKKILSGVRANAQARRRFAPRYLTNVLRNIPAIAAGHDVRSLGNAYRGMPAVIAGAGPSLDDAIPELRGAARRALVIACDTALRPMLHGGLEPQLVVGADPGTLNARHFQSLPDCPDTWLVAESALDPTAVARFHGRTFWFRLAPHHPWPWLNDVGIDLGLVEMWGSVLTAAFQVACLAGCDPIVIVGADLSHTGGRPYARTTTYELDWAHAVARGETPEETWRGHVAGTRPIERPDLRGVTTATTPTMLAFRDWLVARARRSGRRVINATGAGMLFGDGIEQGVIRNALTYTGEIPPVLTGVRTTTDIDAPQIAARLQIVRRAVDTKASSSPVADWMAFTEGGLDHAALAAALDEATAGLESPPRTDAGVSIIPYSDLFASESAAAVFRQMPESIERLKAGLSGAAPPSNVQDRGALLLCALELLARISEHITLHDDLDSGADPARLGKVPASALYPWPEATRWAVVAFEALLGCAWHNAVRDVPTFEPPTSGESDAGAALGSSNTARPHATQACLALLSEWLRCVASVETAEEAVLRGGAEQLTAIEASLRHG